MVFTNLCCDTFAFLGLFINFIYTRHLHGVLEYWPKAGERLNASKHDKEHSIWYKNVAKVVLSKTLDETGLKKYKGYKRQSPGKHHPIKAIPRWRE